MPYMQVDYLREALTGKNKGRSWTYLVNALFQGIEPLPETGEFTFVSEGDLLSMDMFMDELEKIGFSFSFVIGYGGCAPFFFNWGREGVQATISRRVKCLRELGLINKNEEMWEVPLRPSFEANPGWSQSMLRKKKEEFESSMKDWV